MIQDATSSWISKQSDSSISCPLHREMIQLDKLWTIFPTHERTSGDNGSNGTTLGRRPLPGVLIDSLFNSILLSNEYPVN